LTEIRSFPTVTEPEIHTPGIGYSQTLRCDPPYSYPAGSVYWGYTQSEPYVRLVAVETDDRVLLDYDG